MRGSLDSVDVNAEVRDDSQWPSRVRVYELYAEYREWAKENRISSYDTLNLAVFSDRIKRYGIEVDGKEAKMPAIGQLEIAIMKAQGAG